MPDEGEREREREIYIYIERERERERERVRKRKKEKESQIERERNRSWKVLINLYIRHGINHPKGKLSMRSASSSATCNEFPGRPRGKTRVSFG